MKRFFIVCVCLMLSVFPYSPAAKAESNRKTIKVLAIGNSFSQDAVEYLHDIAAAGGVDMLVGNLYIGGCSLETHWNNASTNAPNYTYFKFYDTNETQNNVTMKEIVESEDWDYIVMQQVSQDSGRPETYEPYLTNLSGYLRQLKPQATQMLHQTWAYEIDSTHSGFAYYNNNQQTMFTALKDAYNQASVKLAVGIIPSGEAMQKARANPIFDYANGGKTLNRDGFHATYIQGRYLLASVWYETLSGKSILDNPFTLNGLKPDEQAVLKKAAHDAAEQYKDSAPIKVLTIGSSFLQDGTDHVRDIALKANVNILAGNMYIGGCNLETHWNNIQTNAGAYQYTKYYTTKEIKQNATILDVLNSEDWDYVVLQQDAVSSGRADTFEPYLTNISNYITENKPKAEILIQQTWAFEIDSIYPGFAEYYGSNQQTMFSAIKSAYNAASQRLGVRLIPSGEAMQMARATAPFDYAHGGKTLCRDGLHASLTYGRDFLGLVWVEVLTGKSALDNPVKSDGITDAEQVLLKQVAHNAVSAYKKPVGISLASRPVKTTYLQGEKLNLTGGRVSVTYDNHSVETADIVPSMVSGFDSSKTGNQEITVTLGAKSTSFMVSVVSRGAVDKLISDIESAVASKNTTLAQLTELKTRYNNLSITEKSSVTNIMKLSEAIAFYNISYNTKTGDTLLFVLPLVFVLCGLLAVLLRRYNIKS